MSAVKNVNFTVGADFFTLLSVFKCFLVGSLPTP